MIRRNLMKPEDWQACFYYPSTVAIIDDSERFLTKLSLELDTHLAYVLFNEPKKALSFIEKNNQEQSAAGILSENVDSESYGLKSTEHQTKVDLSNFYHKVYDRNRFNETSVVVVDYAMPDINGQEFCKLLQGTLIKKVMLTGEADEALAVKLFNDGVLNKFISKSLADIGGVANKMIAELQKAYFVDKSKTVIENLKAQEKFHLNDPAVYKVFTEYCQKNNIVEYYMIGSSGSCLLLDYEGVPAWFLVIDEDELHDFREVAEDHGASSSIIKLLREGKKIPFFPSNAELMRAEGNDWEGYLYSAEKVIADKTYYYAFVQDQDVLALERNKIISFKDYLENEWPPK